MNIKNKRKFIYKKKHWYDSYIDRMIEMEDQYNLNLLRIQQQALVEREKLRAQRDEYIQQKKEEI